MNKVKCNKSGFILEDIKMLVSDLLSRPQMTYKCSSRIKFGLRNDKWMDELYKSINWYEMEINK